MGVRGAWTTFRKLFKLIDPLDFESKRIGIDMFSLIYTHRTNLDELLELLKSWSLKGHSLICIWDGSAPKDKHDVIEQRRSVRDNANDSKLDLQSYLENFEKDLSDDDIKNIKNAISCLSWQGWHLSGSLKKDIQVKLGDPIKHVYAPGEADDMLLEMLDNKEIDIIMTLDSDLFAMGGEHIWRLINIRKKWIIEDIYVEDVCNKYEISLSMLQDICFLAGWDRCHLTGSSYMTFDVALNRIKYYKSLEKVLEKFPSSDPDEHDALLRLKQIKKESKERWLTILKGRS